MYFEEAQVKSLVQAWRGSIPGSELVCDAMTPFMIRSHNLQLMLSRMSARLHWGLRHGRDVESWGNGIRLLEEWFYFDRPEPRLGMSQWMGRIAFLGKAVGIYHYQLGTPS